MVHFVIFIIFTTTSMHATDELFAGNMDIIMRVRMHQCQKLTDWQRFVYIVFLQQLICQ